MALCVDGGLWKPGDGWSPCLSRSHNGFHFWDSYPILQVYIWDKCI